MNYDDRNTCQYADYARWHLPGSYDRNDTFRFDPDETWCGTYFTDQGQVVTAKDAISMADALERSLAKTTKNVISISSLTASVGYCSVDELIAWEVEGLDSIYETVPELIAFCRRGSFTIS